VINGDFGVIIVVREVLPHRPTTGLVEQRA